MKITGIDKVKKELNLAVVDAKKLKGKKKELLNALRAATPVDTGNAMDSWSITSRGLSNDAEYIDHLNNGSSTQAPANFIEAAVLSVTGVQPNGIIVSIEQLPT